jgi:hypothetical protein
MAGTDEPVGGQESPAEVWGVHHGDRCTCAECCPHNGEWWNTRECMHPSCVQRRAPALALGHPDTAAIRADLQRDRGCLKFDPFHRIIDLCDALDAARQFGVIASRTAGVEAERAEQAEAQVAALTVEVLDYRNAITWDTTCFNCAKLLDSSYAETVRAEKAEAERDELRVNAEKLFNKGIDHFNRATKGEAERDRFEGLLRFTEQEYSRDVTEATKAAIKAERERDALRAEWSATPGGVEWEYLPWTPKANRTEAHWESMLARQRNRAAAAEAKLDAVRAACETYGGCINGYDPDESCGCLLCEVNAALDGPPE